MARAWLAIEQTGLAHARSRPAADDGVAAGGQAVLVHFQGDGGHISFLNVVFPPHTSRIFVGGVQQKGCGRVDQVKYGAQVYGKTFLALAYKHIACVLTRWAAGHFDGMHMFLCIGLVGGCITQCLGTDVIDGLLECGGAVGFGN